MINADVTVDFRVELIGKQLLGYSKLPLWPIILSLLQLFDDFRYIFNVAFGIQCLCDAQVVTQLLRKLPNSQTTTQTFFHFTVVSFLSLIMTFIMGISNGVAPALGNSRRKRFKQLTMTHCQVNSV